MLASLKIEHFLKSFKQMIIMILRKSNKSDYIKVKIYRLIAFENIINKIMKSIITKIINYLIKIHELLSSYHYEKHSNKSIKDTIIIISENIYKTWKKKKIYTTTFINIINVFNNIYHEWLIYNLWKYWISHVISLWIINFL